MIENNKEKWSLGEVTISKRALRNLIWHIVGNNNFVREVGPYLLRDSIKNIVKIHTIKKMISIKVKKRKESVIINIPIIMKDEKIEEETMLLIHDLKYKIEEYTNLKIDKINVSVRKVQ